jgi:hypothetical protein
MSTDENTEKVESLKMIVDEQRRDYDYLLKIYERAGTKENALLTATFAVIAYLYYTAPDGTHGKTSIAERLFFPTQDYGKVIYIMAAALFVFSLYKLVFNVFGDNVWHTAYQTPKTDYSYNSLDTLKYFKKRYDTCHKMNLKQYITRKKDLTFCFYGITISAIILIAIKTLK